MIQYFDHCATTPPYEEVVQAVAEAMKNFFGNPSSIHRLGLEAERLLKKSRETIAGYLHVPVEGIIFTSGGTESNNLAIKGAAMRYRERGNHLITSAIEHPSVLEAFQQLEKMGFSVTYLPVDKTGQVSVDDVKKALTDETILVSIMHVNNEMGRIQPVEEIGRWLKNYPRVLFHVDAVQSIGKLGVIPSSFGIDLLTGSAHKIRGPKGVGFLYRRPGIQLHPLFAGGGQEYGVRSGTENVPLIVGMAKAFRLTFENWQEKVKHLYRLREMIVDKIRSLPELHYNGSDRPEDMAPHIVNFSFPGMKSEVVVHAFEKYQIYVSTRSACSSGEDKPSRVLKEMGLPHSHTTSGIRVSLSADHTEEDVRYFCEKLEQVVEELKPHMSH